MNQSADILQNKLKKIQLLVVDVDGTLTDGGLILGSDDQEFKRFDVQDGFGLVLAKKYGIKTSVITAKQSDIVQKRMQDLKIDYVYQNVSDKMQAMDEILFHTGLSHETVCYVGDELTDVLAIKNAGVGVAVANAREEVKHLADYITEASGGYGAVRETVELILHAQNKWETVLQDMGVG